MSPERFISKRLAAACASLLCAAALRAEIGGEADLTLEVGPALEAYSASITQQEHSPIPLRFALHNASGLPWAGATLALERWDAAERKFRPSDAQDGLGFDAERTRCQASPSPRISAAPLAQAAPPIAADWHCRVRLRAEPEQLILDFADFTLAPDATLWLDLDIHDNLLDAHVFRLRFVSPLAPP